MIRLGVLLLIAGSLAAGMLLDPEGAVRMLHERRFEMLGWVREHYALAVALYMAIYVTGVALSLPGAVWATMFGGFLFGTMAGTIYTVVAATTGATVVFLAARFILGDALRRRAGRFLGRLEPGLRRHAFNYLVVLRMLPIFPFWVVNLAPALVGMRLKVYFAATLVGIIPGSLVFTSLGAGLAEIVESGQPPGLAQFTDPAILLPLLGLSLLALAPVAWAHWKPGTDA